MPEPLSMPGASPPVLSTANITKAPLMTVGAALVAVGTALQNGTEIPHTWEGWLRLAGGLAVSVLLALLRGPQRSTSMPVLLIAMAAALMGCTGSPVVPGADQIGTLVVGGVRVACAFGISAEQRPAVSTGLIMFGQLLASDPATALGQVQSETAPINDNPGMALIWAVLHQWLDGLGARGWDVYGATLLRQCVTACAQAIA